MSLLDNLKKFAQPYADDDYDDYDDDEEYLDDDFDEPAPRRAPARTSSRRAPAPAPVEDEEDEEDYGCPRSTRRSRCSFRRTRREYVHRRKAGSGSVPSRKLR